jgi:hypothetical protein
MELAISLAPTEMSVVGICLQKTGSKMKGPRKSKSLDGEAKVCSNAPSFHSLMQYGGGEIQR